MSLDKIDSIWFRHNAYRGKTFSALEILHKKFSVDGKRLFFLRIDEIDGETIRN